MKIISRMTTGLVLVLFALPSMATELVLEMNDEVFRGASGEAAVVRIKRQFLDKFSTFDWERYSLKKIDVVAKSRGGRGQMWLEVGQDQTRNVTIEGSRENFDSNHNNTFREYEFPLPQGADDTKGWRLAMTGRHRIRYIKATLNDCWAGDCPNASRRGTGSDGEISRVLRMNGDVMKTGKDGQSLALRAMLKDRYPNLRIDDLQFKNVTIVAKSRGGKGRVTLRVGKVETDPSNIGGSPEQFDSNNDDTFYPLTFNRPSGAESDRPLRLNFRGTFRVKEIKVTLERLRGQAAGGASGNNNNNNNAQNNNRNNNNNSNNNNNRSRNTAAGNCTRGNCPKGRKVVKSAQGPRSCYRSSDGRYIDKRENARVAFRDGCSNGQCVQKRETCYISRTCMCANGTGRCKEANSCGSPKGCQFGFATKKMHCPSGVFNL